MKKPPPVLSRAAAFASSLCALVLVSGCTSRAVSTHAANGGDTDTAPAAALDVAVGEVRDRSAVIWSRATGQGSMTVSLRPNHADTGSTRLDAGGDYTGRLSVDGLEPATVYAYRVTVTRDDGSRDHGRGRFRTAPARDEQAAVRFLFGGDLAGQNVCRDADGGFPIFTALEGVDADFFIGLGDMIYADALCEKRGAFGNDQVPGEFGLASSIPGFHAHWRYSFADPGFARLRQRMAYYAVWDDHEVINDFSAERSRRGGEGPPLLPMGLAAFLDYNPLAVSPGDPNRLYRRYRWGEHVEVFLLDTRQFRNHKSESDTPGDRKTMLGAGQRRWLLRSVSESSATWKFIVTSVPLAVPTGWPPEDGRDGWADDGGTTGFEHELMDLLRDWRDADITNLVWLAADVHFATGLRLRPFTDSPDFLLHELIVGPLNAGLFANRQLDPTLNPERLFFHGPEDFRGVTDYQEALSWMNAGLVSVDEGGTLSFQLLNARGSVVTTRTFTPR